MNPQATPPFLAPGQSQRLLLFGGKGGVGKTTCSAAAALHLARNSPHLSFLLVSTDPAHSLVNSLAGAPALANLEILELNAQECLAAFRDKHNEKFREIATRGTFLDDDDISQFLNLSLPGLDELMALLEISAWSEQRRYDCIVVDTAPTGHTIRLLMMPELIRKWLEALDALLAKHRYMKRVFGHTEDHDDLDRFLEALGASVQQMQRLLRDPADCRFVPVMIAEILSVQETVSLVRKLHELKVPVSDIVVNRLHPDNPCGVCADARSQQAKALQECLRKEALSGVSFWGIPFCSDEVRGQEHLDRFWQQVHPLALEPDAGVIAPAGCCLPAVEAAPAVPGLETALLLFAGKGGVGKTTMACATAMRLAHEAEGRELLLFSTDPAHSLSDCLDTEIGPTPTRICPGLTAMEIDAQAEFDAVKKEYQTELRRFLKSVFKNIDLTFDRDVMERIMDLSPPGIDEVMALTKAMEFLAQKQYDLLILDSAPTGHLIRLLEMPELIDEWLKAVFGLLLKYKRLLHLPKLSQRLVQMSKNLRRLRALLGNPAKSALYAVTILTDMAFAQTVDLVAACRRMGVTVPVLFLNLATPLSACPFCSALHRRETQVRTRYRQALGDIHQALVSRQHEPRGQQRLEELGQVLYQAGDIQQVLVYRQDEPRGTQKLRELGQVLYRNG